MKRILVIRFSSMGDVLLTAPVLRGCIESNPDIKVDFLCKKQFHPYLSKIEGLNVIGVDTNSEYKGLIGILRLSKLIRKKFNPDIIIDLHGVLRSRLLALLLSLRRTKVFRINKGRSEKRNYLSGRSRNELVHTVDRYKKVFENAGISSSIVNYPFDHTPKETFKPPAEQLNVGISPFARHEAKTWPLSYVLELMNILSKNRDIKFHFYGGMEDSLKLGQYNFNGLSVENHAGVMSPADEMKSIAGLDLFISMDSANMHLADLLGVPVFSIWGGTHPDLGFRPLNQAVSNTIQTEESLACQPCSVFGNKPCTLKDTKYKCLFTISPSAVASKILSSIS